MKGRDGEEGGGKPVSGSGMGLFRSLQLVLSTDISVAQCWDSRRSPAAFLLFKGSKSRGRLVDVETNNSDSLTLCEIRSFHNGKNVAFY